MAEDLVSKVPALHLEFAVRQGADARVEIEFLNDSGAAANLTGYDLFAQINKQEFDDDVRGEKIVDWTVDASNVANGIFVLTLHRSVTATLPAGLYLWDALLRAPDLSISNLIPNTVKVVPGVTEPPV